MFDIVLLLVLVSVVLYFVDLYRSQKVDMNNLIWRLHGAGGDTQIDNRFGFHGTATFHNGFGVSVIDGEWFYCKGDGSNYELAVEYKDNLCYSTPITSDVLGWLEAEEVVEIMQRVQNFGLQEKLQAR